MSGQKPISQVRKRLLEHWGNFEYQKRPNLEVEQSVSSDTDNAAHEVIDLTSEAENSGAETSETEVSEVRSIEDLENVPTNPLDGETRDGILIGPKTIFPFKLVKSEIYDQNDSSEHFITLESIFGAPGLSRTWLFSFQFELDFILPMFAEDTKVTIIAQLGTVLPATRQTPRILKLVQKLETLLVKMPPYACHHSKLVVNQFKNGDCRIYIPSNNFTSAETNIPTQIVWCSPLLKKCTTEPRPSAFKSALFKYLQGYPVDMQSLIKALDQVDFLPLDLLGVEFVYSHPEISSSGLPLLSGLLRDQHHTPGDKDKTHHYLAQVSTIGSPIKTGLTKPGNLFAHLMIPLLSGLVNPESSPKVNRGRKAFDIPDFKTWLDYNHIKPYIVYPTVEELRTSPMGYLAGGWFHHHWKRNATSRELYHTLKRLGIFYKRNLPANFVRKCTPAHTKFLMKSSTTDPNAQAFKSVDWLLFTTANLSMNAWGAYFSKPRNYEVGVLLKTSQDVKVVVESATDLVYSNFNGAGRSLAEPHSNKQTKVCVLVPFEKPPVPYNDKDDSFCISAAYEKPDTLGNLHQQQD
ncbi:LAME_0C07228g1_1 [Lachancea meyersii CBS 8951]|uniref:LAME_0C07228g1_1 n=1 Tax=Lachancea meyersii CBS 8951 TaxID=1266667 RepID=A0A1G4J2W2_9SACH|nr:LAME_0C07228g1_1 [Lachancea meyersii CBS 8951]